MKTPTETGRSKLDSTSEIGDARRAMQAAHRPALAVSGPYGHPFHPLLATVPIGAWVCTVALDVASKVSDPRAYARPAVWLCAIGIASALVAAAAGLIDSRRITRGTRAHKVMTSHMVLMLIVVALFVASFVLRRSGSSTTTYLGDGTPVGAMALGIAGLCLLVVGGWLGGRLVYTFGVRVKDEADQLVGYLPVAPKEANAKKSHMVDPDRPEPSTSDPKPRPREESTS